MIKLNPKEYEYLWTDYDVNFIFISCYLFKDFRETDFVLIYEPEKNCVAFFLAKEARIKCSNYGLKFYQGDFEEWKNKIDVQMKKGRILLKETKKEKNSISSMNDQTIKQRFLERVQMFQELGNLYFYTEFFFLDKVEEEIRRKENKQLEKKLIVMGKIKLKAREVLNEFYNYARIFQLYIKELEKRTKRKDLHWLGYEEIIEVIEGKEVPITERGKETWILTKKKRWELVTGKEAETIKESFTSYFFSKNANSVKGMVANKGIYKGRVKILKTIFSERINEELKKVQKGDVLIANTTGPEVMSACERAGAIVTDEGGITSHAAIVSRELGIPCIVGTKIASHIFKDGDIVEVDANRGRIRKIKKSN